MTERNPNEHTELPPGIEDLRSIRELILWEFNNLQGGTRLNYEQYWRARILLATMSVGFLGICLTGKFNFENSITLVVSVGFWALLVFLFYCYDCQVNDMLDSHEKKSNELRNALCNLKDKQEYDNLKEMILQSIGDERNLQLKSKFQNSRLRRFRSKLKSGFKLETVLYYSIIVLIIVASFASLFKSRKIIEDKVKKNKINRQDAIIINLDTDPNHTSVSACFQHQKSSNNVSS